MIPKKGGVADRLGIKFTGNPDARDNYEKEEEEDEKKPNPIDSPGCFLIEPLS